MPNFLLELHIPLLIKTFTSYLPHSMDPSNSKQLLSFLRQNSALLAQLLIPQPPEGSQQSPPSATPVQPASHSGIISPQQFPPPSQPAAAAPPQPVTQALSIPAAPIRPYSSLNMLATVAARGAPSSSTSFPAQTAIGRVNQERLEHSASSGDNVSGSEKKRTKRKAKRAPALDAVTPMIDHTLNTAGDGSVVVNLEVLVRFAMPNCQDLRDFGLPRTFYHYTRHITSFKALLRLVGLLHIFDNLPVTTRVHDLMKHLVDLCTQAGVQFPDTPGRRSLFSSEEMLPIELLGFTSNSHINNSTRTPRLITVFVDGAMTLADVVNNVQQFAIARHVVTSENHFILNFAIRSNETIFDVDLNELCLGSDRNIQPHRCLGLCTYGLFRSDIDAELDLEYEALDEEAIENHCVASDSSGEEDAVVAQLLVPQSNALAEPSNAAAGSSSMRANVGAEPSLPTNAHPSARAPSAVSNAAAGLETRSAFQLVEIPVAKLWDSSYTPPARLDSLPKFFSFEHKTHIFNVISTQFGEVNGLECPGIEVKGPSLDAMVNEFIAHMRHVARCQDWTPLLCESRTFVQVRVNELGAFLEGLKLPCKDSFDLTQIAHSYFGGASAFVVDLMCTTINSLADLRFTIRENLSERDKRALCDAFAVAGHYHGSSFSTLFQEFLEGVGAPSAGVHPEQYDPLVASTLKNIDQPTYRMKMFCWAALGAPRAILDEDPIKVRLVSDEGTISFKTCTCYMLIPVSHLIRLLRWPYDESSELRNVKAAVHNWLLTEILNGIGVYSIL
ncbi:hypothetical protein BT96DRAFT_1008309 [Gymnopus androsaceus JB14]|uniref:Uncharacterized protein n=1 Tax=Gymnopus androsaceus JB14 TaxID=1447944 RepID=A0A6A4GFC1_9AGAR|nr:hypothetical protein BT96DRAFT_1008309 [Gymnopus androsaceus JB14]